MVKTRKPNRLRNFDYSQAGYYFVTICVKNGLKYFGSIHAERMFRNHFGEIAAKLWSQIPSHFEKLETDESIVMPNHIHGILIIEDDIVGDANLRPLRDRSKMLLSKAIQNYKAAVTREIRRKQNTSKFEWQRSFYDHIIRSEESLCRIRKYIRYNPLKWEYDQENNNDVPFDQKQQFWNSFLLVK